VLPHLLFLVTIPKESPYMSDFTVILNRLEQGDPAAAEELLLLVYATSRILQSTHVRLTTSTTGSFTSDAAPRILTPAQGVRLQFQRQSGSGGKPTLRISTAWAGYGQQVCCSTKVVRFLK